MLEQFVQLIFYLIVAGCIFGLLLYLVSIAPVPEPYKGWLRFVVIAVGIVMLIYLLLGLISGGHVPTLRLR